jgi:hypothetical protein
MDTIQLGATGIEITRFIYGAGLDGKAAKGSGPTATATCLPA